MVCGIETHNLPETALVGIAVLRIPLPAIVHRLVFLRRVVIDSRSRSRDLCHRHIAIYHILVDLLVVFAVVLGFRQ